MSTETRIDGSKVRFWATKREAIAVAKAIGWSVKCVAPVRTRFCAGYALAMGGEVDHRTGLPFLSREGFGELFSAAGAL